MIIDIFILTQYSTHECKWIHSMIIQLITDDSLCGRGGRGCLFNVNVCFSLFL